MADPADPPLSSPSAPLLGHLRTQLRIWQPFDAMGQDDLDWFLARARQQYFEPGEVLLSPAQGPAANLLLLRQGQVRRHAAADDAQDSFAFGPGDLIPLAAVLGARPVRSTYTAIDDVFVLALPAAEVAALAGRSPPFADFLRSRMRALLRHSAESLQQVLASRALAQQTLEAPLARFVRAEPVHCPPQTPLRDVLRTLHERHVGSMLVTDGQGRLQGIFTRQDLLERVLDPGFDLDAPIAQAMRSPVHTLEETDTVQDAVMLMGERAIRHVPLTRAGALVGIVSERDLFALQRSSLQQVGARIHRAGTPADFRAAAEGIRALARDLFAQGVQARQLTELISRLNDVFTRRLLASTATRDGIALERLCWLALGSEGRGEQTVATDQDNALVLPDDVDDATLERVRTWADGVNRALDDCGYPLCRGGIMAGQPACCLRLSDWLARFGRWIEHGTPEHLLRASIFFDLRALAGDAELSARLLRHVAERIAETPRFLHQLAANALAHGAPFDWAGRIDWGPEGAIDLKLQGTALFVEAARVLALAQGVQATSTRERLLQVGRRQGLQPREYESWAGAFEFLQGLRLRLQLDAGADPAPDPNRLRREHLNEIDRRILAASLREARNLQQRLRLDWARA